jgi:hypothetical protein
MPVDDRETWSSWSAADFRDSIVPPFKADGGAESGTLKVALSSMLRCGLICVSDHGQQKIENVV